VVPRDRRGRGNAAISRRGTRARALLSLEDVTPDALPEIVPSKVASMFHALPPHVQRVLRLCDGTRTAEAIGKLSRLGAARTRQVLDRLVGMGAIIARAAEPGRRRSLTPKGMAWVEGVLPEEPAFSAEEESFFSSPIDHLVADEFAD